MAITHKGITISGNSGEYRYRIGWMKRGPFEHLQDAQDDIDEHVCDHDDENIYGLASIRQSIEQDRR